MRYLSDQENQDRILSTEEADELRDELNQLGNSIASLQQQINADKADLQDYKDAPSLTKEQLSSGSLYVSGDAEIGELSSQEATITSLTSEQIETQEIQSGTVEADFAEISDVVADKVRTAEVDASVAKLDDIDANNIATSTIAASSGAFESLDINTASIEHFNVEDATLSGKLEANEVETPSLKATTVECDRTITSLIESDAALLQKLQTHNIIYDDTLELPYYIPIEPGTFPTGDEFRVLEVPYFENGDYYLCLKHPSGVTWWAMVIHNNHNNITVSYSRRTKDLAGEELTVPTLDSFYIWDYLGETPKLYIKTFVGGNLYWQNQSLNEEGTPRVYDDWPFDVSRAGALHYLCLHDGATWFSKHIDIIRNQSLENASLFIIPTDWNNCDRSQVEYNGMIDIPWHYYVPDQSLNTNDEVQFKNLIINPLDGKWVYNIENALQGKDPETIGANGQLNPKDNIIETEELVKWNGKVGIPSASTTTDNGTIFREQAYKQSLTSANVFEKVPLGTYDFTTWNTQSSRTDIVSVRRKSDQAIIISSTRVKTEYEDPDLVTWDLYTYTYYDIDPSGAIFEEWIERELPDGTVVHRLLQSTVNSNDYINYTRFEEPFYYGTIDLGTYAYGSYSNSLTHLGDVEEGRWDAGDIHVTKRSTPQTGSSEPAYNGNLVVDGSSELRGNMLIRDRNDLSDVKNVEHVDVYTDNLDVKAGRSEHVIGTDWDSYEDHAGKATIKYSEMELIGHKEDEHGDEVHNISNILIRDDVTIGKNEVGDVDKHNLIVNGKIFAENITVPDGEDGDNMRFRNVGTVADPEIVSQAEPCAEVENGVLITTDHLITGEKVGEYNGTTNPHKTTDTDYDPTEDAYPIIHLGDGTTVHGDVHVVETAQIDGDTTIGKPASGLDPAVPADLRVIGNEHIEGTSQLDGDVTVGIPASGADPAVPADLHVTGETQHDDDVILGTGGATPNKVDLYVNGDIYQYGSSYETHAEQIYTTKDHIILRDGAVSGLITGEHSGIQVMNYDGSDTQFHLCIGRDGYGRVGDTDASGDPVAETYSYEFSDYHLYKDTDSGSATYGHYFDDKKLEIEHNFYIPTGATNVTYTETAELDEDDQPTGLYTVTMEYDLTGDSLQKLLTIEETPQDQSLLYWDAEAKCSRTLIKPATVDEDHALVPVYNGSHVEYRKYMSAEETGNGSVWRGTQAEFNLAVQIPEGDDGYIPNNCVVILTDKNDYLHTDDITITP